MLIHYALLLGFSAATLITLFRAIPLGQWLVKTGKKPWACDVCMSFWAVLIAVLGAGNGQLIPWSDLWTAIPAYIVCLWFIKQTAPIDFNSEIADNESKGAS